MGTVVAQWGMAALFAVSVILVMLATVFAASLLGITGLATLQVALSVFSLLACVCDSLAISGQAIAGHGLGVARTDRVLLITRRLVRFGVLAGMLARVVIAVLSARARAALHQRRAGEPGVRGHVSGDGDGRATRGLRIPGTRWLWTALY